MYERIATVLKEDTMQNYARTIAPITSAEPWKEHSLEEGLLYSRKVVQRGRTKYQVQFTTTDGKLHKLICTPVLEFLEVEAAPEL